MLDQRMKELEYFDYYLQRSMRLGTMVKVLSAISGSSGLLSLAIWGSENTSVIKTVLLSLSGIAAFLGPFLPYTKRTAAAEKLVPELRSAYSKAERDYFNVRSGVLSEEEVNDLLYQHEEAFDEIKRKYEADTLFPESRSISRRADKIAEARMNQRFCQIDDVTERDESNEQATAKTNSSTEAKAIAKTAITISSTS